MYHTNEKVIKNKVGLLNLAEELGNISKACKIMGLSRETFYRWKRAYDANGETALINQKPCARNPKLESKSQLKIKFFIFE